MLGRGATPPELGWVRVMDRVGGFAAYLALERDANAFDDIVTVIRGEAQAATIRAQQARIEQEARASRGR